MIMRDELKQFTHNLSILFVDDASDILQMYHFFFDELFKNVYEAEDGVQALEIFKDSSKSIDLILTDQSMPVMNGIEMIRQVRKINQIVPIILVTATKEHGDLIDAINLNVTNFVEKPVSYSTIMNAIEGAVQKVIVNQLVQKNREQELEILKYKNAYSNFQEASAFKKQLNIIKNDLYKRRIDFKQDRYILIDHYYKPKDILSGDTYSIHKFCNGKKLFFFIIDAMGKGLSASVSTFASTSFINYFFDKHQDNFDLKIMIETYLDFIRFEILEEEIISAIFGVFDIEKDEMELVNFSMPPVIGLTITGEVKKLTTTNLPITAYSDFFKINKIDTSNILKVMLYSDGLTENTTIDNTQYLDYIENDFKHATTKSEFMKLFSKKIQEQEDDTTLLYLEKLNLELNLLKIFNYKSTMTEVDKALEDFSSILDEFELSIVEKMRLESGFTELIMNAYEHGNLGVGSNQKQKLMESGNYTNFLLSAEVIYGDKNIMVKYYMINGMLVLNISDEGKGFDTNILKTLLIRDTELFHGRGIAMSDSDFDFIMYNDIGNSVLFGKKII
jgi:CheY-like chemotaxis protein